MIPSKPLTPVRMPGNAAAASGNNAAAIVFYIIGGKK
jgi:hypothetical protein